MSYTEQDVERAAPRVWAEDYFFCHGAYPDEADPPVRWEDVPEAIRVHARAISRAALGAMEREPRIAELEAQVARLRAAVHDLRCSVDAGEFQDVVAAYLQTGDLDAVAAAKEQQG